MFPLLWRSFCYCQGLGTRCTIGYSVWDNSNLLGKAHWMKSVHVQTSDILHIPAPLSIHMVSTVMTPRVRARHSNESEWESKMETQNKVWFWISSSIQKQLEHKIRPIQPFPRIAWYGLACKHMGAMCNVTARRRGEQTASRTCSSQPPCLGTSSRQYLWVAQGTGKADWPSIL